MGGDGRQAQSVIKRTPEQDQLAGSLAGQSSPILRNIMANYAKGGVGLQDALTQAQNQPNSELTGLQSVYAQKKTQADKQAKALADNPGLTPERYMKATGEGWVDHTELAGLEQSMNAAQQKGNAQGADFADQLSLDPNTALQFATDKVQSNPILGQYFGKGGALDRTNAEEQRLASQGFKLQPEDYEAYGQASGDIARQFGQGEQDLAQSLASRGLASGGSSVAGREYSGLQGNKLEMLAKAQTDIANKRMQNTLERLGQTRNFMSQLGQQGQNALQNQYGNALSSRQQKMGERLGVVGSNQRQQQMEQDQLNKQFEQQEATKGPGLGDILGGIGGGLLGAATGGFGTAVGGGLGKSLFGAKGPKYDTQTGKLTNAYDEDTGKKIY